MRRKSWSLLLAVVFVVVGDCAANADDCSDLIRRIKQTQSSLGNFDVVIRVLKYSVDDANRMIDTEDIQCELQRFIALGDRFVASRDILVATRGVATIRRHDKRGFDGKRNWSTIAQGHPSQTDAESWSLPRRHDLLVSQFLGDLSLTDTLLLHDIQLEGETSVDGIPCQVLLIRQPSDRSVRVWIATRHNYIPLKAEEFVEQGGTTRKIASGFASDWREVSTEVWFPYYLQVITATGRVTETFVESLTGAPPEAESALTVPKLEIHNQDNDRPEPAEANEGLRTQPAWVWMLIINDAIMLAVIFCFGWRLLNQFRSRARSDRRPR